MLLHCQGSVRCHWEQELMHCNCQDVWDLTGLTDPQKPTGEGPANEMAGPDILIFWSLDISSLGITHGEEANAVKYPKQFT